MLLFCDRYRVCGKGQGDTYGAGVKRKASNWGRNDKASRERARREKKRKDEKRDERRMRDFERRALAEPHPQMCSICLTELVTHLVLTCGAGPPHYHRGHGYCEDCATNVVVPSGVCALCQGPVQSCLEVGTAFLANP